mmetsp:Transcript_56675/g.115495  ORF Transcript_56675/g.115495 Transcript_56675/m.115495 type:complete len:85 (+) Transcript_56675:258-512(+)
MPSRPKNVFESSNFGVEPCAGIPALRVFRGERQPAFFAVLRGRVHYAWGNSPHLSRLCIATAETLEASWEDSPGAPIDPTFTMA